jgi:hypothetical protein
MPSGSDHVWVILIGEGRSPNGQGRLPLFDLAQLSNLTGVPLCESALWIDHRPSSVFIGD